MDHSEGSIWWIVDGYSMDSIDQGNLVDTWWIIDHWWIVSPTGTGRHTGFHTARDPLVIELAIHPPTNLVDWWIVARSHLSLDSRLSQRGFLIKPTVNPKKLRLSPPATDTQRGLRSESIQVPPRTVLLASDGTRAPPSAMPRRSRCPAGRASPSTPFVAVAPTGTPSTISCTPPRLQWLSEYL